MSDLEQKQNNVETTDLSTEGVDVLTGIREENEFDGTPSVTEEEEQNEVAVPVPPKPIEQPVVEKKEFVKHSEPVVPVNPAPQNNQITTPEITPQNNPGTKAIRTFRLDTAEAIQGQKTSMVKMVMAEQQKKVERGESVETTETNRKPLIFGLLSISVILIISVAVYVYYPKITQNQKTGENTVKSSTILTSAKTVDIATPENSTPFEEIAHRVPALTGTLESITTLKLVDSSTKKIVPIEDIFVQNNTAAPDILLRSLAPEYLFGVYFKEGNTPFIVLKNTFFQNAFAGMLAWETNLEEDLRPIINIEHPGPKILQKTFSDSLIKNKQVRILKDASGKELLFYTFTDQNTLLITTNRVALEALIDKLTVVKVVR